MSVNLTIQQGNLTKDPWQLETKSETVIACLSIAINSGYKNKVTGKEDVDFIIFKAFGKQAELALTWLTKGQNVTITGRIKNANYEKDGKKVYKNDYVADKIHFGSKKEAVNEQ